MSDMDDTPCQLPEGEYAIVEQLGHRTMIGRYAEIERFGGKMMALEPLFGDGLLPPVYIGGPSIYQVTPCTREIAWKRRPRYRYQLPSSVSATLPPEALPEPETMDIESDDSGEGQETSDDDIVF